MGAASWTNVSPATWNVQAFDLQNDPMTLNYQIDGAGDVYTAPLSGTPKRATGQSALEGTHSVDIWVTDVHGYPSDHRTGYFKLDATAPTTGESTSYLTSTSTPWSNVDLASPSGPAVLAASDAVSGIALTQYRIKTGGSWGTLRTFATPITITDQNSHEIEFWATDVAGNLAVHKSKYYNLDKTAPTASETTSYLTTSASAWQSVNLPGAVLAGTDALSGPASVHYRLKTGAGAFGGWTLYAAPITLSDEATHEIEFYATDNAGNDGAHLTRYYNLDKTNPALTMGSHNAYYNADSVTFTWSASDNLATSGELRYQYKLVPPGQNEASVPYGSETTALTATFGSAGSPLTQGSYSFYCKVRDNASNWDTKSFTFVVDRTAPSISGLTTPAAWNSVNYLDFGWSGSDNVDLPGALTYSYRVTKGGSPYISQTSLGNATTLRLGSDAGPLPEGSYVLYLKVSDQTGNTSTETSRSFGIDRTNPTVAETTSYLTTSASAWQSVNLPGAVLAGTDALSGPASVHYRLKTGAGAFGGWTLYAAPITLSDEATHEIEFYATDAAGNDSAHLTRYYNLDKTNPALTMGSHNAYYNADSVTFTWSASDNLATSGELRYQYKLVPPGQNEASVPYGSETTALTATFGSAGSPLTQGSYSFYCKVRDNASNWDTKSFTFVVDRTAPSISGLTTPAAWNSVNYLDFGWSGSDNVDLPGALTYSYRVTKGGSPYISQTSLGSATTLRLGSDAGPLPEGSYVLYLKVSDQTGNTSTETSRSFGIDRTNPTVAETTSYLTTSASAWQSVNLPGAVLAGTDALSGPASVHYRLKTGAGAFGGWTLYAAPITLSDEATHEIEFYATDAAGNDSAHLTRYYNLDKTAPDGERDDELPDDLSRRPGRTSTSRRAPMLAGSDALSGLAGVHYRVKTGARLGRLDAYAAPITLTRRGRARRRVLRDRQRRQRQRPPDQVLQPRQDGAHGERDDAATSRAPLDRMEERQPGSSQRPGTAGRQRRPLGRRRHPVPHQDRRHLGRLDDLRGRHHASPTRRLTTSSSTRPTTPATPALT